MFQATDGSNARAISVNTHPTDGSVREEIAGGAYVSISDKTGILANINITAADRAKLIEELDMTGDRLEYLRGELRAERISYSELAELQGLASEIESDDVELLEAAGVPEQTESVVEIIKSVVEVNYDLIDEDVEETLDSLLRETVLDGEALYSLLTAVASAARTGVL